MKKQYKISMKTRFAAILAGMALLALQSCSSSNDAAEAGEIAGPPPVENRLDLTETQFQSSGMKLGKMENREFNQVVKANGMLDVPPENRAAVSSYFGGTVKNIHLLPGQKISKGQVLFVLENPEYIQLQQDYLEAKGQLLYLKSDYERQKSLVKDNVTSEKQYLKAESDYTVTQVKMESIAKKLRLMNIDPDKLTTANLRTTIAIPSPISGYVTSVDITQGAFLNPSQVAVSIINTDHLHLELNLFEKDLSKVKVGQPIQFRIQEEAGKSYPATVHLINKMVDPEDRTIRIHGHLTDEKAITGFNPGMYVEAEIFTTSESRLALPSDAIVEVDGAFYVLLKEKGGEFQFAKKEVQTGATGNGFTEILNAADFGENAEFLVQGAFNLITE